MRHIEKLKKIFTCCGKECSADTNGQALDELVTLAENGELGGGDTSFDCEIKLHFHSKYGATFFGNETFSDQIVSLIEGESEKEIVDSQNRWEMTLIEYKGDVLNTVTEENGDVYQILALIGAQNMLFECSEHCGWNFSYDRAFNSIRIDSSEGHNNKIDLEDFDLTIKWLKYNG